MRIDNSPDSGNYFLTKKEFNSREEIQKITSDPEQMGFVSTVYSTSGDALGSQAYFIGDKMKSTVSVSDANAGIKSLSQWENGFPLPKPDSFGICDNFKSAHFFMDDQSSCTQMVDIATSCDNLLNAQYYSTLVSVFLGQAGKDSDKIKITLGDVYSYDSSSATYSKIDNPDETTIKSDFSPGTSATTGDCSCENYLTEIEYDVHLKLVDAPESANLKAKKYYEPHTIKANIVLGKNKVTATCGQKTGFKQNFKIRFNTAASGEITQKMSGNPGYIKGFPVKLGYQDDDAKPIQTYMEGFEITGGDLTGACYDAPTAASTDIVDYGDPVVNFKQDLSYGCSVQYDKASLKTLCADASATVKKLQIFKNLDQMKKFGKFGNANLYYPNDWSDVSQDDSFKKLGQSTYDDETGVCSIYSSVLVKIVYSQMGFTENLQNYIVDIKLFAI